MATRDESHLFSLAALTTRSPAAPSPPPPAARAPHIGDLELNPTPELPPALGAGWPLLPLGAPLGGVVEPPPAAPSLRTGRGRTLALVVAASLLGAAIVTAAAWPGEPATPPTLLGPEISTETLARPSPASRSLHETPPAPPAALEPEPESQPQPVTSAEPQGEQPPPASKPPRRSVRPPVQPPRNRGVTPPAPPPARGPCAHCASGDLACNIKCRAG